MKLICVLFLLTFVSANGYRLSRLNVNLSPIARTRRAANGCGTGSYTINSALQAVGEGPIITCCNAHDVCYETCGQAKAVCDNAFQQCLQTECNTLKGTLQWWGSIRVAACKLDGKALYNIVRAVGTSAYNEAQKASGCTGSGGGGGHGGGGGGADGGDYDGDGGDGEDIDDGGDGGDGDGEDIDDGGDGGA